MNAKETGPDVPVTAAAGEKTDVIESMTQLYTSGIERVAEIQKKGLDLAIQHNTELVNAWKQYALAAPGIFILSTIESWSFQLPGGRRLARLLLDRRSLCARRPPLRDSHLRNTRRL